MLINDEDCDVGLPSSLEDRYIQPQGYARPRANEPPFTGFLAIIHAARLFSQSYRALKSTTSSPQTLQAFDDKLRSTLLSLPDSYQPGSSLPLEPTALTPLLALQTARFLLYRREISPAYRPHERAEALRRCTSVAQETTNYLSRTLHSTPDRPNTEAWRTKVVQLASNMICTHLWRCILMLCFRADYKAALMCLHLSSAIGGLRKINIACGKHIAFFLDRLLERIRSGGRAHQLEHDEEMLAYVSGDLQSDPQHAWVWASSESTSQLSPISPAQGEILGFSSDQTMQGTSLPLRPSPGSPGSGTRWDGWRRVEQMIHQLMEEHRAHLTQPTPYYPPPHNPVKRVQLAPGAGAPVSPPRSGTLPPPTPSSTSRISIANII